MPSKIICDVANCIYNQRNNCQRENIRVLANTPEVTGREVVSCMSFRNRELKEANAKPELAGANIRK